MTGAIRVQIPPTSGLRRILQHDRETFVFIVGGRSYECGVLQACFISPRVNRLVLSDCTVNCLELDNRFCDVFESVLRLGEGQSITIPRDQIEVIRELSASLENDDLFQLILSESGQYEGEVDGILMEMHQR